MYRVGPAGISRRQRRCRLSPEAILRIERYWLASETPDSYAYSVRVMDVLWLSSTVAGSPAPCRTRRTWVSRLVVHRDSPAIVLFCLLCMLMLEGCAGFALSESKPSVDVRGPVERLMTFRTLGSDQQFSELSSVTAAEQLRATRGGKSLAILALSGGGAGGAFGAGAVAGLTRAGMRPEFDVVTGVSAGALVAPYAFLGPSWDTQLLDAFAGVAGDNLLQSRGLGVIFGSSVYSGRPLRQLVDAYVTDEMIRAIAREAAKGRLLLVQGTGDDNVHIENSIQFIQQLIDADLPYDLQLYPRKTHGISGAEASAHLFARILAHFQFYLQSPIADDIAVQP